MTTGAVPLWPTERLGEALGALGRALGAHGEQVPDPPADLGRGPARAAEVARWVRAAAQAAGLTSAPMDVRGAPVAGLAPSGEGALLAVTDPVQGQASDGDGDGQQRFLALVGARNGSVGILAPDESVLWVPAEAVGRLVRGDGEAARDAENFSSFCDRLDVTPAARATVADVLGRRQADRPLRGWSLVPEQRDFVTRLRAAGGPGLAARTALFRLLQYGFALGGWVLVGRGALDGRLEPGWLWAWALMLLSMVTCVVAAGWSSGKLAVQLGGLSRERLLEGILGLESDVVRTRGVGQLLGTVLETEALESLARAGGPQAFMALIQLGAGAVVLALGAAPLLPLGALLLWLLLTAAVALRYWRRLLEWADARLALTHDLVESMVGHRTVVAQRGASSSPDDARFTAYERRAADLDAAAARLFTIAPRGWLLVALTSLLPGFISGASAPDALAIGLGGTLLIYWSLRQLAEVVPGLAAAALAWRRTRPLFGAVADARAQPVVATATDDQAAGPRGLLVARDVGFHYPGRFEPVLRGCSFAIRRGERVLLSGGSGSGKSTLGALLSGLRRPSTGALLLGGFDHHSLGPGRWRERSGGVPQFHENHVLCAPLVFNLAMGRGWPPTPDDWKEIQAVCGELGLAPLLTRMPAGLQQMVGDSGWQLSHGERSRIFVARSLLMDLDVRVLDESFAALDPETFEQVLDCVLRRTRTLIVVAHI